MIYNYKTEGITPKYIIYISNYQNSRNWFINLRDDNIKVNGNIIKSK